MSNRSQWMAIAACVTIGIALCIASFAVRHDLIPWFSRSGLFLLLVAGVLARRITRNQRSRPVMDWYEVTAKYNERTFAHEGRLAALPEVWQRELASLWRLEADVNNGAYLQFIENCGRETYEYASQALSKIGAHKMADIVNRCQALVDEHFDEATSSKQGRLLPNAVIDLQGNTVKEEGSALPDEVVERIMQLSYEFMSYPDDVARLGLRYYGALIANEVAEPSK